MSLQTRLAALITAIGADVKALRAAVDAALGQAAGVFGAGAAWDPETGTLSAPIYLVQGGGYYNVDAAIGALDSAATILDNRTTALEGELAALQAAPPIVPIMQIDYDALSPPDAGTLYVIVDGPAGGAGAAWLEVTQAQYDALDPPDSGTLYIVID